MKVLMPIGIAVLGLGAGIGAGIALKPAPEAHAAACAAPAADAGHAAAEPVAGHDEAASAAAEPTAAEPAGGHAAAEPCPPGEASPLEPAAADKGHGGEATSVIAIDKPFVVPVFSGDKVVAMVVASVAVEIDAKSETLVEAAEPKLRDGFLAAMFRHANSGGFEGAFTTGQKMADLRAALVVAAREVFAGVKVSDVLITEIAKQDV